jgi:uncharacterized membrane protein HdeD (DUF308 family)
MKTLFGALRIVLAFWEHSAQCYFWLFLMVGYVIGSRGLLRIGGTADISLCFVRDCTLLHVLFANSSEKDRWSA